MANQEHVERLIPGVEEWNQWRKKNQEIRPDLSTVDLSNANLIYPNRIWTDPGPANLSGANLSKVNLSKANLSKVNLSGADLSEADLRDARLNGANLSKVNLSKANLRSADLSEADLCEANLSEADLYETNLSGADLLRGILRDARLDRANLEKATLIRADLLRTDLPNANLTEAALLRANLYVANLYRARLSGADLRGADLRGADLREANLFGAYLCESNLRGANLSGAILKRADLSLATCSQTIFMHIDFRETEGLALIIHHGPSAIHLSSLELPQDSSALHFLREVGLTDAQIDLWRSTALLPTQYYSVFISYSSKDTLLAHRLHTDLQARGVRCWFAPEDIKIGNKIRDRIDQAIHLQDRTLLLLSEQSINSTWVENEVEAVLEKEERQKREVLFPLRLDDVVMQTPKAWAATLRRTRHIGDFTQWTDPQAYNTAFERLLRDLQKADH